MGKNWFTKMSELEGAVIDDPNNPYLPKIIESSSPSFNFVFGNSHGLPRGDSAVLYGPPKGGKSILSNDIAAKFLIDNPESHVIKFNTEFREKQQLPPERKKLLGIDPKRYMAYETNDPLMIFDRIAGEINDWCSNGMDLGLIIIDSSNSIRGRRSMKNQSIETQQIGDVALTIKEGLKLILPIQRKHRIALLMTAQIAAEMDPGEQMRGNKTKMAAGFGLQHHCEYFMLVEPWRSKEGRSTLTGEEMVNEDRKDTQGNAEKTGHKCRVIMKDNSCGPKGRVGTFTIDYNKGIVNQEEEVFLLAMGAGLIVSNGPNYKYVNDKSEELRWNGKANTLHALKEHPEVRGEIMKRIRDLDLKGHFAKIDEKLEKENAEVQREE